MLEHIAELALTVVGVGLSIFGIGFAIWAKNVDVARDSLDRMAQTLREIVDLRIRGIGDDVSQIKSDLHEFVKEQHNHAIEITKLQERHRQ